MNIRKLRSTKISQEKFEHCMGCKDRGDSGANGGIRISTNEFGKQPEGYWCKNLCENDTKMCTVKLGQQKF